MSVFREHYREKSWRCGLVLATIADEIYDKFELNQELTELEHKIYKMLLDHTQSESKLMSELYQKIVRD